MKSQKIMLKEPIKKPDFVELSDKESRELGNELAALFQGQLDIGAKSLLFIYTLLYDDLKESGGCDHSVGICACSQMRVLDMIAAKLGYPFPEGDYSYINPAPDKLVEYASKKFEL